MEGLWELRNAEGKRVGLYGIKLAIPDGVDEVAPLWGSEVQGGFVRILRIPNSHSPWRDCNGDAVEHTASATHARSPEHLLGDLRFDVLRGNYIISHDYLSAAMPLWEKVLPNLYYPLFTK